jgi:hypothetical protein
MWTRPGPSTTSGKVLLPSMMIHEPVPKCKLGLGESFGKLRTNGALTFVVSWSNHETLFCLIFGTAS